MKAESFFSIGYISKTQGLKGEVQVYLQEDVIDAYFESGMLYIEINNKPIPHFIEAMRIQKNLAYFALEDLDTIEKAAKLITNKVLVPINLRPKRKTGDLTYKDLAGFFVEDEAYGDLGLIREVFEYPKQFIAAVDVGDSEVLIPLNDAIIKAIDLKTQKLLVTLPEGLLDVYLK